MLKYWISLATFVCGSRLSTSLVVASASFFFFCRGRFHFEQKQRFRLDKSIEVFNQFNSFNYTRPLFSQLNGKLVIPKSFLRFGCCTRFKQATVGDRGNFNYLHGDDSTTTTVHQEEKAAFCWEEATAYRPRSHWILTKHVAGATFGTAVQDCPESGPKRLVNLVLKLSISSWFHWHFFPISWC